MTAWVDQRQEILIRKKHGVDINDPNHYEKVKRNQFAIVDKMAPVFIKLADNMSMLPGVAAGRWKRVVNTGYKIRTERSIAIANLLYLLVSHCDFITLRIGYPKNGVFYPRSVDYFTRKLGKIKRNTERALRDVVDGGIVETYQRYKIKENGDYEGHIAVRTLDEGLFEKLGFKKMLESAREQSRISQSKRAITPRYISDQEKGVNKLRSQALKTATRKAIKKAKKDIRNKGDPPDQALTPSDHIKKMKLSLS